MRHRTAGRSAHRKAAAIRRNARMHALKWAGGAAATGAVAALPLAGIGGGLVVGTVAAATTATVLLRRPNAAARWTIGATAEEATARVIDPLKRQGWTISHDLALPGTRANVDHLAVPPGHRVLKVVDTKRWRTGCTVGVVGGRLMMGYRDETRSLATFRWEARKIAALVGTPPTDLIIAVQGSTVPAGGLTVDGIRVVSLAELRAELLRNTRYEDARGAADLARLARVRLRAHR